MYKIEMSASPADREMAEDWLRKHGDTRVHYGFQVDLSVNEARKVMAESRFRTKTHQSAWQTSRRLQILYNNKWLNVCRTDLKDDVATTSPLNDRLKDQVSLFMRKIKYGARISYASRYFAVVDSYSDG